MTQLAEPGLRRGAIGLREVLFQSITAMAPGAAIAASIPSGAGFAGGALPLAVIVAMVACLFAALSIAELARHLPTAGSVATYSSRGLHPIVGFLVAWGYVFVQALVPTLLLLQLGFTVAGTLNGEWSGYPADLWWPWALLGAVIIGVAGLESDVDPLDPTPRRRLSHLNQASVSVCLSGCSAPGLRRRAR